MDAIYLFIVVGNGRVIMAERVGAVLAPAR